jgi:nucleotide-binding universal stress UspA family protein
MHVHILVPIDGSDTSEKGLAEAIRTASGQARITLLTVIDGFDLGDARAGRASTSAGVDVLIQQGRKILSEAAEKVGRRGIPVETVLIEAVGGRVAHHIVDEAENRRADLIVMGTHGRGGVTRLVLGSDAEKVVQRSAIPVMLVRGGDRAISVAQVARRIWHEQTTLHRAPRCIEPDL